MDPDQKCVLLRIYVDKKWLFLAMPSSGKLVYKQGMAIEIKLYILKRIQ